MTTKRAQVAAEQLGPAAVRAVGALRRDLAENPRLGLLRGARDGAEVYVTHIERTAETPAVTVAYVFAPDPPPPTVAIALVQPHSSADVGDN
ncbi:hypothetical protein [Yinghuangia seranimata]|uniref:hypothetical protein n=1 Tax=Yinghuangia seranimata TaxID=408067 RepID=UPI00248BDA68|nr:hypothetical protein [Yinghuangia seranimata]MDI2127427.1 hypothetical protein [Yinghuangia seranimata]